VLVKKPTDVAERLGVLRPTLERLLGGRIQFEQRSPDQPWGVQVDRGQLDQVMMNLCTNARDAISGAGQVLVSVENVTLGQDGRRYVSGDFVRLGVYDDGCGIDSDVLEHVFDPFFTTKGADGTGLGLSVALGIVEQHGGWIDVESEVGKGSVFRVYLPADRDLAVPRRGTSAPSRVRTTEGARVLLVDDEPSVLRFVSGMLRSKGFAVISAESREEAFGILNREGKTIDLVFSDAMLPDGTGMDVILHSRALSPDLPALLSSGYSDDRALLARAESEDVEFLPKPYSLQELMSAVEGALGAALVS
jgi:CheY-like chemotaxis protein